MLIKMMWWSVCTSFTRQWSQCANTSQVLLWRYFVDGVLYPQSADFKDYHQQEWAWSNRAKSEGRLCGFLRRKNYASFNSCPNVSNLLHSDGCSTNAYLQYSCLMFFLFFYIIHLHRYVYTTLILFWWNLNRYVFQLFFRLEESCSNT